MNSLIAAGAALLLTLSSGPVFAESINDAGGTGAVAGEGPGGSGAGQTSGGPQRVKLKRHHRYSVRANL